MKDFYKYVNKKWLDEMIINDDSYKVSNFNILDNENDKKIYEIIIKNEKMNKFYNSYVNKTIQLKNIYDFLDIIDDIKNLEEFVYVLSFFHSIDCCILWNSYVSEDLFNSKVNTLYISQGDLCLYDKSLYHSSEYKDIIEDYKKYIYDVFNIVYKDDILIKDYPDIILNIEKKLSNIMLNKDELRDINYNYKIKLKYFNENFMNTINLNLYMKMIMKILDNKINISYFEYIFVEFDLHNKNNYFSSLNDILKNTNINVLKLYLKWKFINKYLPEINNKCNELYFNFYKKKLSGQKKLKKIKKIAINKCKLYFGDLIGHNFGKIYFNEQLYDYINEMIDNIIRSCSIKFKDIKWMEEKTKENALIKLYSIKRKIGYNNYIHNYDDLKINDNLILNLIRAELFLSKNNLHNLIKNNDNEWLMNAHEVNASYNPSKNEIIIPCGILQKDIINYEIKNNKYIFNDMYNYATIGTIIGHEIIHGFDDQGRLFDKDGNYNEWWSINDDKRYKLLIEKMINMYNKEGINGKLTTGENIADIGGLTITLKALYIKYNNTLTDEQLREFFTSYAILWRTKLTKEYINIAKLTDYHSLPWIRVNTTLKNIDDFYKVYDVENGYKKEDRFDLFN